MDVLEALRSSRSPEDDDPRRRQILEAAGRLFYRYGFRRTSLDDIARECRVSKKTIYQHFGSKDDLVCAVLFELVYEKLDSILWLFGDLIPAGFSEFVRQPDHKPETKSPTREMLKAVTDFAQRMRQRSSLQMLTDLRTDYPELWQDMMAMREPFVNAITKMIERGQRSGDVHPDVNPLVATELMLTGFESTMSSQLLGAHGVGLSEIGVSFLNILSHGLLIEPPPVNETK